MQVELLWAAASLSLVTFGVHTFIGGVFVARPLLADTGLPRASKWLNYYCWHLVTLTILALGLALAWSAHSGRTDLAVFAVLLSAAFSCLSIAVAIAGGIHPLRFPSTTLFALITLTGSAGLAG
ncbi:MAG: hypothetical protein ACK55V_04190 [Alphaproteobacteria bacterium]